MIDNYFKFTTIEPKTAGQPYIVNYDTNMDPEEIALTATAEGVEPGNIVGVTGISIVNNTLYVVTNPFTPSFDFKLTLTAEKDDILLDTKVFEISANAQKGTTKKSSEQLINEWTLKLNK